MLDMREFKRGQIVTPKTEWLNPGEEYGRPYLVLEVRDRLKTEGATWETRISLVVEDITSKMTLKPQHEWDSNWVDIIGD